MGLIQESNSQYYSGQKVLDNAASTNTDFTFPNYNTELVSAFDAAGARISSASNFKIFHGLGTPLVFTPIDEDKVSVKDPTAGTVTINGGLTNGIVMCQLQPFAISDNYGGYSWISLNDLIDNFVFGYIGQDKILTHVNRNDIIFQAKRCLQEFSYDIFRVIKSQELTIPPSLSVPIPQDYVNYVNVSWCDSSGIMHTIYPLNGLSSNPYELPLQDGKGIPTQDSFEQNLEANSSIIESRWNNANDGKITGNYDPYDFGGVYDYVWWKQAYGQRYGLQPSVSQDNGWFSINEREGKFSFSSGLSNSIINLEYISDGLAYDNDMRIPKMAEDAMYSAIMYNLLSTRRMVDPNMVMLYKKEKYAKMRNAKIRLQNLKLEELTQTFRNQSKWIKS